jgi:hypothetical protein
MSKKNLTAAQKKDPAEHKATVAPQYPRHMMGKMCGYELFEDGSIQIAPSHYQKIDTSRDQEAALQELLAAFTRQCHQLAIPITQLKEVFWQGVKEDYGLDFDKYDYTYNHMTHKISRTLKKDSTDASGGQDASEGTAK